MAEVALKRVVSLPLVVLYGMGNILGAGIYVLVGKVAGEAGYAAPLAFLLASTVAAFTAFSYAELSGRFPVSAGEATYIHKALNRKSLSIVVGFVIAISGIVSSAAILHGFAAYLDTFVSMSHGFTIALALLVLTAIAIWGIKESIVITALFTLVELFGLLFILYVGMPDLSGFNRVLDQTLDWNAISWAGVFAGGFLAFYAYIGFEDIVNIAEEVQSPKRNMPLAVLWALVITSLIYIAVAVVAIAAVEPATLASSEAPLAMIYSQVSGKEPYLISSIALFAVINGALIQLIMASRVFYGMARNGWLPKPVAFIYPRTHTPVVATILAATSIGIFASLLTLVSLAKITSFLLLMIFALINISLLVIKLRDGADSEVINFPLWVPVVGLITCLMMLSVPLIQ